MSETADSFVRRLLAASPRPGERGVDIEGLLEPKLGAEFRQRHN
ncbi:hypothetical protein AB0H36_29710 [Kribbella sp. NPDC050820]